MNKKQLVAKLAGSLNQSKADAERTFDTITNTILDALKNDDSVKIAGFGTYKVAKRKARIGRNCMIGGQVGIIGHLKIGDNVKIQAQAGVTSDIKSNSRVTGTPAISHMNYNKSYIHFKNLPEIVKKIDKKD